MSLKHVETAALSLAKFRKQLLAVARPYANQIQKLQREFLDKCATEVAAEHRASDKLHAVLVENEAEFQAKKTLTIDGIKCGWRINAAKISCGDEAVDLILASTDAERFLHTKVSVNKEALEALNDDQLIKIACARTPAENKPFIADDKDLEATLERIGAKA